MLSFPLKVLRGVSLGLLAARGLLAPSAHADAAPAAASDAKPGASPAAKPDGEGNGAAADVLFQEGKSLMTAGKVHEACPKFTASYKLERKMGTLLNLADCLEKDGKIGSAYERFGEAVDWAKNRTDDRGEYAKRRQEALAPRVPKLRLSVTQGAEKLSVFRDGTPVSEESFGLSIPVDPGTIEITVRRGDDLLDKRIAKVEEGRELEVPVDLAAIARAHPPQQTANRVPTGQRTAGFVVGAVGLAGLATFGILEGAAYGQKSKADAPGGCKNGFCTPAGFELNRKAGNLAEAGQWVGVASAGVVAVGVTLLLTAPRSAAVRRPAAGNGVPPARIALVPVIAPGSFGLLVGGDF